MLLVGRHRDQSIAWRAALQDLEPSRSLVRRGPLGETGAGLSRWVGGPAMSKLV